MDNEFQDLVEEKRARARIEIARYGIDEKLDPAFPFPYGEQLMLPRKEWRKLRQLLISRDKRIFVVSENDIDVDVFERAHEYMGLRHPLWDKKAALHETCLLHGISQNSAIDLNAKERVNTPDIAVVASYVALFGLKMTGLWRNSRNNDPETLFSLCGALQKESLAFSWLECSCDEEDFVISVCGDNAIIDPYFIKEVVYPKHEVAICDDGKHYVRSLPNGYVIGKMLAVGTIFDER